MSDEMDKHPVERFRTRLEADLQAVEKEIEENAAWSAPVELNQPSGGPVSCMDATQMQAMFQVVQRRRVARRIAVQQALKRALQRASTDTVSNAEGRSPSAVSLWTGVHRLHPLRAVADAGHILPAKVTATAPWRRTRKIPM